MKLDYKNILWFFGIIFIQIFFLDALDFGKLSSFFSPVIISFFVLKQRLNTSMFQLLISAFFLGIIIDIFRNSLGLNTAIILLVAYLKPTYGEIGCALSHIYLWQKLLDSKHPFAIVFEDDAIIKGDLERYEREVGNFISRELQFLSLNSDLPSKIQKSFFLMNLLMNFMRISKS